MCVLTHNFYRIFELAPGAIALYGFGGGIDERNIPGTLFQLPLFQAHAKSVVQMLENALVMMLGDEMDSLALALQGLGARHVEYGVQPSHYIIVETALLRTLEAGLGDAWTMTLRKNWAAVAKFVGMAMKSGSMNELEIVKEQRKSKERRQWATLRLKLIQPSQGTSRLSRAGPPDRCQRKSFQDTSARLLPQKPQRRRNSDPPQQARPMDGRPRRYSYTDDHENKKGVKCMLHLDLMNDDHGEEEEECQDSPVLRKIRARPDRHAILERRHSLPNQRRWSGSSSMEENALAKEPPMAKPRLLSPRINRKQVQTDSSSLPCIPLRLNSPISANKHFILDMQLEPPSRLLSPEFKKKGGVNVKAASSLGTPPSRLVSPLKSENETKLFSPPSQDTSKTSFIIPQKCLSQVPII